VLRNRKAEAKAPLLYFAGEDRAADLVGDLAASGIVAEMRVVYRAATAPFPDALVAALESGDVQAAVHFSKRSAENYLAGAVEADIAEAALKVRHYCLSAQVAAPLQAAGAKRVAVAPRPEEAALIELLPLSPP
jgi:uroporphyrinogen-III synthase